MQKFSIPAYSVEALSDRSFHYLKVEVKGYWNNPIEIMVDRKLNQEDKFGNFSGKWDATVSTSSGGTESDYDNLEAYSNFAEALTAAIQVCKDINSMSDVIEAAHQEKVAKWEEESNKIKAEHQALIDADPAIGEELAAVYVENAIKLAKSRSTTSSTGEASIDAYARGSEINKTIFEVTFRSRSVFRDARTGLTIKKADVIKKLAQCSIRSVV